MDIEKRQKIHAKLARNVNQWIEINASRNRLANAEAEIAEILEEASEDSEASCAVISIPLMEISNYLVIDASYKLLRQDLDFVASLRRAHIHLGLVVAADRLTTQARGFYSPGAHAAENLFHALCLAIVFDDAESLERVQTYCTALFDDGSFAEEDSLDVVYGRYALALGSLYRGASAGTIEKLHPNLDGLFQRWNDAPQTLAPEIMNILDYHLLSASDWREHQAYHREHFPDYVYCQPFCAESVSTLPLEVLAIYRLRDRLGLETPTVEHPLMNPLLYRATDWSNPGRAQDDLTQRVGKFLDSLS